MNSVAVEKIRRERGLPRTVSRGVRTLLSGLFMVGLFPWVSFNLLPLGIQPWPLVALSMMTLFFVLYFRIPSLIKILGIIVFLIYIPIVMLEFQFDFITARAIANYLMVFVSFAGYFLYRKYIGSPIGVLYTANTVWLASGLIQYLFGRDIFSWLLIFHTSPSRGVTGLAPEPSFYGIALFFLSWLIFLESKKWNKWVIVTIVCNLLAVVFLAKSATVFLFYLIAVIVMALVALVKLRLRNFGAIIIAALILAVSSVALTQRNTDSRMGYLLSELKTNPLDIIAFDASVNARIQGAWFPWYIAFNNFGMPGSAHGYQKEKQELLYEYPNYLFMEDRDAGDRIMSTLGVLVFQQGVLFLFLVMFSIGYIGRNAKFRGHLVVWYGVSVAAIPVAFPMLWFVWASLAFAAGNNQINDR